MSRMALPDLQGEMEVVDTQPSAGCRGFVAARLVLASRPGESSSGESLLERGVGSLEQASKLFVNEDMSVL
ncbi:hypothetical protein Mapa_003292 [Marchantia paleacea]|nr:hypothetical protein Mapa_003292 [Marchantia paleacea]